MKSSSILGVATLMMLTASACAVQPGDATQETSSAETAAAPRPDPRLPPPPPAVSLSATIFQTGPNVCVDGTHYEPGSGIAVTFSNIPGRTAPYVRQTTVGSSGTAQIILENYEQSVQCSGGEIQGEVTITVQGWVQPPAGSVAQHSSTIVENVPAAWWCANANNYRTYNGGC